MSEGTVTPVIAGLAVGVAAIVIFAMFVPTLAIVPAQVPESSMKSYIGIGDRYGVDVIFPRIVRDIVRQVLAEPQVANLTENAYSVIIENNFEGYDELPNTLTIWVTGNRTVQGDWETTYTITDYNRTVIIVRLDGTDVESIELKPARDSMRTFGFSEKRQEMIRMVMEDGEVQDLLKGKDDVYVYHIRDWGVGSLAGDCPPGSCAIVSMRQVYEDESLSTVVNTKTGKVAHVGYSEGWLK